MLLRFFFSFWRPPPTASIRAPQPPVHRRWHPHCQALGETRSSNGNHMAAHCSHSPKHHTRGTTSITRGKTRSHRTARRPGPSNASYPPTRARLAHQRRRPEDPPPTGRVGIATLGFKNTQVRGCQQRNMSLANKEDQQLQPAVNSTTVSAAAATARHGNDTAKHGAVKEKSGIHTAPSTTAP